MTTRSGSSAVAAFALTSHAAFARPLSFEERVAAQEAIERVHHRHRIGTTTSFEQAVPRELLERKAVTG